MVDNFKTSSVIIYLVRLPRVLGAVVAGAGLSVSGVLLQNVTGNDLAGPNIIGINSGAGFAMIVLLFFMPKAVAFSPLAAFLGAFLTTLLIVSIAEKIKGSSSTVILAGIAVTSMLNAGISFISLLDSDVLATYNYFSVGGLSGVKIEKLIIPAIIIIIAIFMSTLLSRQIDSLPLGENIASSIGVNVKVLRIVCLALAGASAAAVVSFAGLLGFVGLVVPHIARRLFGSSCKNLIPTAALIGAILVVIADIIGRTLFAPSEIPVGIIMAFIGVPFFFKLFTKNNK